MAYRRERHSIWLDSTRAIESFHPYHKGPRIPRAFSFLLVAGVADEAAVGADFIKASHFLLQQEPLYILRGNLLESGTRISLGEVGRKLGF